MKKIYNTRLWKEETITFNQGVAGSNPAGLTPSLTESVEKLSHTIEI
jgi:hypothetical protein